MTDNEIIKALKCCAVGGTCQECPFDCNSLICVGKLMAKALDLINRQKKQIERLKKECKAHRNTVIENEKRFLEFNVEQFDEINRLVEKLKTAKSEARREFAEIILNHLQQRIDECDNMTSEDPIWVNRLKWARESIVIFIHECLHKLEKEMEKKT